MGKDASSLMVRVWSPDPSRKEGTHSCKLSSDSHMSIPLQTHSKQQQQPPPLFDGQVQNFPCFKRMR